MDTTTKQIRENERLSHTEIYTKEKLYDTDTWLKKPIKTIQEIVPLFSGCQELRIQENSYDLILAVSALEHIDGEQSG